MGTETIQVVYKPVAANGFHETLVYTATNGHQEFASAYASNTSPQGSPAADLVEAASAAHNHTASPYGTLKAESGDAANLDIFGPPGARLQTETVATGANLSSQWAKIKEAYHDVDAGRFTYSPLTQNSNSTASTAMVAAGIRPPTDNGMLGHHWTPAADNILPIPSIPGGRHEGVSTSSAGQDRAAGGRPAEAPGKTTAFGSASSASHDEARQHVTAGDEIRAAWRRSAGLPSQPTTPAEGQFAAQALPQVQAPMRAAGPRA